MTRFVLHGALLVLVGTIAASTLEQLSRRHPPSYAELVAIEQVEDAFRRAHELEALALGNSHARGLDFAHMGLNGVTLGLPWNDLAEVEYQLDQLVPRLHNVRVVFIGLSWFSLHWSNADSDDPRFNNGRRLFYTGMPLGRWMSGDVDDFVVGRSYWLARSDNWQRVLFPSAGRSRDVEPAETFLRGRMASSTHAELAEHAMRRIPQTITAIPEMLERNPALVQQNVERVERMVGRLRARDIRVVFFTPPYYQRYRTLYRASEPTLHEMRDLMHRLGHELGVEYHDLSHHPISLDPALFRDSDHLNHPGKERFSRELADRIGLGADAAEGSPADEDASS